MEGALIAQARRIWADKARGGSSFEKQMEKGKRTKPTSSYSQGGVPSLVIDFSRKQNMRRVWGREPNEAGGWARRLGSPTRCDVVQTDTLNLETYRLCGKKGKCTLGQATKYGGVCSQQGAAERALTAGRPVDELALPRKPVDARG